MPKFFDINYPVAIVPLTTLAHFKRVGLDTLNLNTKEKPYYVLPEMDKVLSSSDPDRHKKWLADREEQSWRDILRGMCYFPEYGREFRYIDKSPDGYYKIYIDNNETSLVTSESGQSTRNAVKNEIKRFFNNSAAFEAFIFTNFHLGLFPGASHLLWTNYFQPYVYYNFKNLNNRVGARNLFQNIGGNNFLYCEVDDCLIVPLIGGRVDEEYMADHATEVDAVTNTTFNLNLTADGYVNVSINSCTLNLITPRGLSQIYVKLKNDNLPLIINPHFLTPTLQRYVNESIKRIVGHYDYSEFRLPVGMRGSHVSRGNGSAPISDRADAQEQRLAVNGESIASKESLSRSDLAIKKNDTADSLNKKREVVIQDCIGKIKNIFNDGFIDNAVLEELIELLRELRKALPSSTSGAEYVHRYHLAIIIDILQLHKAYAIDRYPLEDRTKSQFQVYCDSLAKLGNALDQPPSTIEPDASVGVINKDAYRPIEQTASSTIARALSEIQSNWKLWQEYQLGISLQAIRNLKGKISQQGAKSDLALDEELVVRYLKLGARGLKLISTMPVVSDLVNHCYVGLEEIFERQPNHFTAKDATYLSARLMSCKRLLAERNRQIDEIIYSDNFLQDYAWYRFVTEKMENENVDQHQEAAATWMLNTIANEVYILILQVIIERIEYLKSGSRASFEYSNDLKSRIRALKNSHALPRAIELMDAFAKNTDLSLLNRCYIIVVFQLHINDRSNYLIFKDRKPLHKHSFQLPGNTPQETRDYLSSIDNAPEEVLEECRSQIRTNYKYLLDLGIESGQGFKRFKVVREIFIHFHVPEKNSKFYWDMMVKGYHSQKASLECARNLDACVGTLASAGSNPIIQIPTAPQFLYFRDHLHFLNSCNNELTLRKYLSDYQGINLGDKTGEIRERTRLAISALIQLCQVRITRLEFYQLKATYCELYPTYTTKLAQEIELLFETNDIRALEDAGAFYQSMLSQYRQLTPEQERNLISLKEDRDRIETEMKTTQEQLSKQGMSKKSNGPSRVSSMTPTGRPSPTGALERVTSPPSTPASPQSSLSSSNASSPRAPLVPSKSPAASVASSPRTLAPQPLTPSPLIARRSSTTERLTAAATSAARLLTPKPHMNGQQSSPRTPVPASASHSLPSPSPSRSSVDLTSKDTLEDRVRKQLAEVRPSSAFHFSNFVVNYRRTIAEKDASKPSMIPAWLSFSSKVPSAQAANIEDHIDEQNIKSSLPDFNSTA